MRHSFSKPVIVWMWQIGRAIRYDCIQTAWGHTHAASLLLPGVNIVLCYTR